MDNAILETARLIMSPLSADTIAACAAIDTNPEVMRFIGGPASHWARQQWLASRLAEGWPPRGGLWLVKWRDDMKLLGWCGLFPFPQTSMHAPEVYEIGYRYLPDAWGHGVATEAARRVLEHGFVALDHDVLVGVTHTDNYASQNVLQKIGLRREGQFFVYGSVLPFFRLSRNSFLQKVDRSNPACA